MPLHSYAHGNASHPGVILIHGVLGSGRNLLSLAQEIAKNHFYVITYDQKGHGHSPHVQNYDLESLAHDVFEVMDEKKLKTSHLIGHSLGGRVALAAANTKPERVKSLTMMDVSCRPIKESLDELKKITDPLPLSFSSKKEADVFLTKHLSQIPSIEEPFQSQLKQFFLSSLKQRGNMVDWVFDLQNIRSSLMKVLETDQTISWQSVNSPTLLIRGSRSKHFNQKELDFMISKNNIASAKIISNAGHWVHVDNFQETARAVVEFLSAIEKS